MFYYKNLKLPKKLKEMEKEEIASIHGPIGIKLGGKSGPERNQLFLNLF